MSHVVTWGSVVLVAGFPDGGLVDCCKDDDIPYLAEIEGRALDPWQRELTDYLFRYTLTSDAERTPSDWESLITSPQPDIFLINPML